MAQKLSLEQIQGITKSLSPSEKKKVIFASKNLLQQSCDNKLTERDAIDKATKHLNDFENDNLTAEQRDTILKRMDYYLGKDNVGNNNLSMGILILAIVASALLCMELGDEIGINELDYIYDKAELEEVNDFLSAHVGEVIDKHAGEFLDDKLGISNIDSEEFKYIWPATAATVLSAGAYLLLHKSGDSKTVATKKFLPDVVRTIDSNKPNNGGQQM